MSSLYGSEAMGGVINIITKKIPSVWSGTASGEYTKSFNDISKDGYRTNFYLSGLAIKDTLSLRAYSSFLGLAESTMKMERRASRQIMNLKKRQLLLNLDDNNNVYLSYDYSKQERVTTPGKSILANATAGESLAIKDIYPRGHNAKYDNIIVGNYAQYTSTYNNRESNNDIGIFCDVLTLNAQGTYFFESNTLSLGAQYKNEKLEDRGTNGLPCDTTTLKRWYYALFAEDE